MPSYKTKFKTTRGEVFPPLNVQAQIVKGKLYCMYRGPKAIGRTAAERSLKGARLTARVGIVEVSQAFWNQYLALEHCQAIPVADGAEAVVEAGGLVPRSWDALILDFKQNDLAWKKAKPSTHENYENDFAKISKNLGSCKVAKTTGAHVEALIVKLWFGDATSTVAKERDPRWGAAKELRKTFSRLYEHARKKLNWVEVNPVPDIEKPTTLNKEGHHTLTEREVQLLREAHPDDASDERAFLEMGITWGPRVSDLLLLGFDNILNGAIRFTPIKTENSTGAEVNLQFEGVPGNEHLMRVLAARRQSDKFFFQAPPKGSNQWNRHKIVDLNPKPWGYRRAWEMWRAMCEHAGIGDEPVIHSMRKLFATRMANTGASAIEIGDALGDTPESAMVYIRKRNKGANASKALRAALAAAA